MNSLKENIRVLKFNMISKSLNTEDTVVFQQVPHSFIENFAQITLVVNGNLCCEYLQSINKFH